MLLLLLAGVVLGAAVVIVWGVRALGAAVDVEAVSQDWIRTHGREDR
jgi:hypothetical protein